MIGRAREKAESSREAREEHGTAHTATRATMQRTLAHTAQDEGLTALIVGSSNKLTKQRKTREEARSSEKFQLAFLLNQRLSN